MSNSFIVEAVRASLGSAYLVGGAIRDSLLGMDSTTKDLDFSTPLNPTQVAKRLESDGYKVIDKDAKFGTVSTIIAKTKVEITTFRDEVYPENSRIPDIGFITNITEDLSRRDFTINAIAHDGENYIDPFNGMQDLISKKIRAVGNPRQRFEEDPLRILRALRFVSTLGFTMDPETYDAIKWALPQLANVSSERISEELDRILIGKYWVRAVALGLESKVFEELFSITNVEEYKDNLLDYLAAADDGQQHVSPVVRWEITISSLLRTVSAVSKIRIDRKMTTPVYRRISEKLKWSNTFSSTLFERINTQLKEDAVLQLREEVEELKSEGDWRYAIVEARLIKIELNQSFVKMHLRKSMLLAKKLIKAYNEQMRAKVSSGIGEEDAIRESLSYYRFAISYICASKLLENGRIDNKQELNIAVKEISEDKDIFSSLGFSVSLQDKYQAIEDGIILAIRVHPRKLTNLHISDIINANTHLSRTRERLIRARSDLIDRLAELRRPPYIDGVQLERSKLNEQLATITLELNGNEKNDKYYSHLIDQYKWRALAASSTKDFWNNYDLMDESMDLFMKSKGEYLTVPFRQYLDSAQCLLHCLTIEKNLDEKIYIVRSIIANYQLVGHRHAHNVPRYRLLLEWLIVAKAILASRLEGTVEIAKSIPSLRSYGYIDIDPDYVKERMPEVEIIKNNLYDAETFLDNLNESDNLRIPSNTTMVSIIELFKQQLIDKKLAFEIYKKELRVQIDKTASIEPVSLDNIDATIKADIINSLPVNKNLELIEKGESEEVEFKESWRYDTRSRQIDPTDSIRFSALKTIASFLNTSGGTLFIGVKDDGEITGLEAADFNLYKKRNLNQLKLQDELKKSIDDALNRKMGASTATLIKVEFDNLDDHTFAVIKVRPSVEEVYLDNKLYVRNAASCRELVGADLARFIRGRNL